MDSKAINTHSAASYQPRVNYHPKMMTHEFVNGTKKQVYLFQPQHLQLIYPRVQQIGTTEQIDQRLKTLKSENDVLLHLIDASIQDLQWKLYVLNKKCASNNR